MNKIKTLVWSDFSAATTGFGVVSNHILGAMYKSGKYDITQLAINFLNPHYDREKHPWAVIPARLDNPNDVYGKQMLIDALAKYDYDLLLVINDTFVVEPIAEHLAKLHELKKQAGKKFPKLVFYFPVDAGPQQVETSLIKLADQAVAYTEWGIKQTAAALGGFPLRSPLTHIYHGADTVNYYPLPKSISISFRKAMLGIGPETFLIVNVNRNSVRKDLPNTLLAFNEFLKRNPDSMLYLHTVPRDNGIKLDVAIKDLGIPSGKVAFPGNYNTHTGFPVDTMNNIYNMGDCFLSTDLGEGWGLGASEAMCTGLPLILPENSVHPEIRGEGRALLVPCTQKVYVDNCYDPDTEVLTDNGWKHFKDLQYTDRICTLNPDSDSIEYHQPDKIIEQDYSGPMYRLYMRANKIDMLVTPNHSMYVKHSRKKNAKWELLKATEVFGNNYRFKKDGNWTGENKEVFADLGWGPVLMKDWVEFLGYFISEGSTTHMADEGHYIVQIRQRKQPNLNNMLACAKKINPSARLGWDKERVIITNKILFDILSPLGKCDKKFIPKEYLNLSKEYLQILFDALMLGDGHNNYSVQCGGASYATTSKSLRDNFQELCLKLGYSASYHVQHRAGAQFEFKDHIATATKDLYVLNIRYKCNQPTKATSFQEEWIDYSGKIYCATVKNHIMYVRRNGCCNWSGNSGYRDRPDYHDVAKALHKIKYQKENKPELLAKQTQLAREFCERYTWDTVTKQWLDLFDEVLSRQDPAASTNQIGSLL